MSDLHAALLAVQSEAPTLPKNATNPHFHSKFTPLDTIVETMRPILSKHGLTWTTKPSFHAETGQPTLRYKLTHVDSGEAESGEMPLLLSKNDPQGQGAAITYARRYAISAVLDLVADEDVDGNDTRETAPPKAKEPKPLTGPQAIKLAERVKDVPKEKLDMELLKLGVDTIAELTTTQANALVKAVA